jgi:hypothetical protein
MDSYKTILLEADILNKQFGVSKKNPESNAFRVVKFI